jgi:hypothetical protein
MYSQKFCIKAKTTLFTQCGPILLEAICEGLQDHYEAVVIDEGCHFDG